MMKTKRIIAMLLTLVMVLGVVPASVFAEPAAPAPTEALEIVETSEPQLPTEEEATEASEEPTTAVTEATEEVTEATEPVTETIEEVTEEVTEPVVEEPADEIIADEPVQVPSNELLAPVPFAGTDTVVTYEKVAVADLKAGEKYLIVVPKTHEILCYENGAFSADVKGTVSGNTITLPEGTSENSVLWQAEKEYQNIYFTLNGESKQYLVADTIWEGRYNSTYKSATPGVHSMKDGNSHYYYRLAVNTDGKLHAYYGRLLSEYHFRLNYNYNNGWEILYNNDRSTKFEYYKRVETVITNATVTVDWYLDNQKVGETFTQTVEAGSTVSLTKPTKIPATAKRIENNQIVADLTEVVVDKDQTIRLDYMSDPVTLTVNYYYEDDLSTPAATSTVMVPNNQEYTITPDSKFVDKTPIKKVVNDVDAAGIALTVTPSGNTTVKLIYKVQPATLKVEWYVTEKANGTASKTNLYKTDVSEVKVGDTAKLNLPVSMTGLTFEKFSVTNGGVLDHTGNTAPTKVTIKNQGETLVKLTYSYNRGNADPVLHPDDATSGLEIPEYPDQGSVRINKTATADNFWGNGIANVELSTTGIPIKKGVDVVLVLDVSGSMKYDLNGKSIDGEEKAAAQSKLDAAKAAAKKFVSTLLQDNADGSQSSNRVGLVTFSSTTSEETADHHNKVVFPLKNANAMDEINTKIDGLACGGGTDYDYAFEGADTVLKDALPSREKFVIFMTDGAPTTYNTVYYKDYDESKGKETGRTQYKNGIIDNDVVTPHKNAETVKNTATVYSIGFGMTAETQYFSSTHKPYNGFPLKDAQAILKKMATDDNHYIDATDDVKLNKALDDIATAILKAGTDAFVSDQMGAAYDLQMKRTVPDGKGGTQALNPEPKIEVKAYTLYTKADVANKVKKPDGSLVTLADIGSRTGTSRVIETVTFSLDGTEAYSNLINGGTTDIKDTDGNIIAKNFAYYAVATGLSNGTTAPAESFIWQIGDITTEEIALSYPVYLTGSMEGKRADGVYDTNTFARIDYTNYKGHEHTEQIFGIPNMPWGDAVINYEFYLVNKEGEPVNTRGEVIPFEHRVKIGKTKQKTYELNSDQDIIALEAASVLPNGYELHMPDAKFEVHAVSNGEGTMKATGSANTSAGYSGNSTHYRANGKNCINTSVAFGLVNTITSMPDVIVLDYGKPVTIDVMANDRIPDGTLFGIYDGAFTLKDTQGKEVAPGRGYVTVAPEAKVSLLGTYGNAEIVPGAEGANATVRYTLTKFFDDVEKFRYVTENTVTNQDGTVTNEKNYYYQEVTVMPATTVYYEDNFGNTTDEDPSNGIVYSGAWETVNEGTSTNPEQDDGSEYNNPYGQDSGYEKDNQLSAGSAHKIISDNTNPASASFTFNGTGFDLIARTDMQSGAIVVTVTDVDGNKVSSKLTDCVFKDNSVNSGVLYQIPVYEWRAENYNLGHGTYTVTIEVLNKVSENRGTFYLDAIRIHNPIAPQPNDLVDKQYEEDQENNALVLELRDLLLKQNTFGEGYGVYVDGGVVDANGTVIKNPTMQDYAQIGPNNEIYLNKGQSIGIKIEVSEKPLAVHLGLKSPTGAANCEAGEMIGNQVVSTYVNLNTATDMYYDMTGALNFVQDKDTSKYVATLIVTNTSANENQILSLTNLKLTFASNTTAQAMLFADEALAEETVQLTALRMSAPVIPEPTEPEVTEPEPTETQPTEPEVTEPEPTETQPTEPEPTEPTDPEKPSNPIKDFFDKIGGWLGSIFG